MKVILAGMGAASYKKACLKYGMTKLYSALNEKRQIDNWLPQNPLMVDSGAHSWNKIGMNVVGGKVKKGLPPLRQWCEELIEHYARWDQPNYTLVEMDVYAELPMADIDELAKRMRERIKNATFMRVFHLCLDDGNLTVLKKWLDEGYTYIGLGLDAMPVWGKIFQLTKDKIRYHGFAATSKDIMLTYPIYSVDSSTAIAGARYGGGFVDGRYVGKDKLIKLQHPSAVIDSHHGRIEEGVKAMKELQDFVTDVWTERGIVWN